MTETLQIRIITPTDISLEQEATLVTIPGEEGWFGVLAMHAPLVASLKPGIVVISTSTSDKKFFIWKGIARVDINSVDIITEFALNISETDKNVVLEKINGLKDSLNHGNETDKQEQLEEELIKYEALFGQL